MDIDGAQPNTSRQPATAPDLFFDTPISDAGRRSYLSQNQGYPMCHHAVSISCEKDHRFVRQDFLTKGIEPKHRLLRGMYCFLDDNPDDSVRAEHVSGCVSIHALNYYLGTTEGIEKFGKEKTAGALLKRARPYGFLVTEVNTALYSYGTVAAALSVSHFSGVVPNMWLLCDGNEEYGNCRVRPGTYVWLKFHRKPAAVRVSDQKQDFQWRVSPYCTKDRTTPECKKDANGSVPYFHYVGFVVYSDSVCYDGAMKSSDSLLAAVANIRAALFPTQLDSDTLRDLVTLPRIEIVAGDELI